MTLFQRRILTLTFLISFLVATPGLILYAAGYRYNFELNKIERTGLLHVTTDPKNTKLVVNGQPYEVNDERIIKGLKPTKYDIIISKDNYHSWYKSLQINPGESTIIRDLRLFLDEEALPKEIFVNPLSVLDKAANSAIFQSNDFLFAYDFINQIVEEIELPEKSTVKNVNHNNNLITFQQEENWFTFNLQNQVLADITESLPISTTTVIPQEDKLYSFTDQGIWNINDSNAIASTLEYNQTFPQSMLQSDDSLWIIKTEPTKQRSFVYFINTPNSRPRLIASLPYSEEISIVEDYGGFLTIQDTDNKNLHLIETTSEPPTVATLNDVHTWQWSKNHTELLTATDFELTIHSFSNGRHQELLRRISTPITDAAWHPEEKHVFYVSNDSLNIIERDNRDERNLITLDVNKKNLQILYVDPEGKKIIYSSDNGNVGGAVWELEI